MLTQPRNAARVRFNCLETNRVSDADGPKPRLKPETALGVPDKGWVAESGVLGGSRGSQDSGQTLRDQGELVVMLNA